MQRKIKELPTLQIKDHIHEIPPLQKAADGLTSNLHCLNSEHERFKNYKSL